MLYLRQNILVQRCFATSKGGKQSLSVKVNQFYKVIGRDKISLFNAVLLPAKEENKV